MGEILWGQGGQAGPQACESGNGDFSYCPQGLGLEQKPGFVSPWASPWVWGNLPWGVGTVSCACNACQKTSACGKRHIWILFIEGRECGAREFVEDFYPFLWLILHVFL